MNRLFWLLCPLACIQMACNEETLNDSEFLAGEAFTDSNIRVVLIDTLTVETSTIKLDSIVTSQSERMLVGRYVDSIFGTVSAASHMGFIPNEYDIDVEAEYDSIALYLNFDGYYYNDTTVTNSIRVKRILKTLRPTDDDNFYNTTTVEYHDTDLGVFSYSPRPLESDTLELKLSDDFGSDLFQKFQENLINGSDEFLDYFKGMALLPGEDDNGSVIGFSKASGASFIRLFFSTAEESERVQDYIDFELNLTQTPVPFFNQIIAEEPIDVLQNLSNKEVNLSSTEANGLSFIQSGLGIASRVQFPYIKNIYDIKGQGTIMDAVLKIYPVNGTYDDHLILRDEFAVYVADRNNDVTQQLLLADIVPVMGVLNRDNEEFNEIYYEISLVSYMEKLLLAELETDEALILLPEDFDATVDRFVLNGTGTANFNAQLELTYAIYDEDND